MFLGEHRHIVDAKGRVVMPARFRDELAAGLVTTRGHDHCLWVFTAEQFGSEAGAIDPRQRGNQSARDRARSFYGGASALPLDAQGRLLVPAAVRHE